MVPQCAIFAAFIEFEHGEPFSAEEAVRVIAYFLIA